MTVRYGAMGSVMSYVMVYDGDGVYDGVYDGDAMGCDASGYMCVCGVDE